MSSIPKLKLSAAPAIQFTEYKKGDETQILALYREVFGAPRSLEHWHWLNIANPYDGPRMVLTTDASSAKIVGHYAVQPVNLNMMGRELKAAQSVDTMVDPQFRMLGIFESSAKKCYEKLRRDGYSLVYGFPNRNSFPGFVRKLGWVRIGYLDRFFLRLSLEHKLRKITRIPGAAFTVNRLYRSLVRLRLKAQLLRYGRNQPNLKVGVSTEVPPHYDELWQAVKSFEILSLWKDAKYFNWRYDRNPSHAFKYIYVEKEGRMEALAVVVSNSSGMEILELIARDRNIAVARYLVTQIAIHAFKNSASRLTFMGSDLDFFKEVFRDFRCEKNLDHVFCMGILDDKIEACALEPRNWTVTTGDSDMY